MGEDLAETYLIKLGYTILERNFRCREGEIDIICHIAGILVCVEVKARTSSFRGQPYEAVTRWKVVKLRRAAGAYVRTHFLPYKQIRIDVISLHVAPNGEATNLKHFQNITF